MICSLEEAARIVGSWRARGERIVLCNGAFDLLHVGHLRYLRGAKALADRLVVGVNADISVRASKGEGRPVINQAERAELVNALSCVDLVIVFESVDVRPLIRVLKPDIHAKGTDYAVETVPERDEVAAYGGVTAITGDPKDHSTTQLVRQPPAPRGGGQG